MGLKRTVSPTEEFEQPPAGTFPAVCVAVVVTGTHPEEWKGVPKEVEKIFLAWELVGEVMPGSRYHWVVGREYTLSLNRQANLRQLIDGWKSTALADGEDFDLAVLAGRPCLVTLKMSTANAEGRKYCNVNGVARPMKGQVIGKPQRAPFVYEAVDPAAGLEIFPDWLPRTYGQLIAGRIQDSREWRGDTAPTAGGAAAPPVAPPAPAPAPANPPDMDPNAYDNEIRF
jgi:hypothetical protein